MTTRRRRHARAALSALAASAVLWGGAWPRDGQVHAQEAGAPAAAPAEADAPPLLALSADEITALPPSGARADASDPRSWRALLGDGRIHRTTEAFGRGDLLLRGQRGRIEALVALPAGDDAAAVEFQVPGATAFEIGGAGHAIVRASGGDVAFVRPGLHQERADGRVAVQAGWQDRGQGRVGLQVATLDPDAPLSIGFHVLFLSDARLGLDRNHDGRVTLDELAPVADAPEGGPALTATKRDTLVVDVDGDTQADPGDTLRYDIVIGNTGTGATGIQLADPLDPNLTLVPGSVNVSPLAGDDTYEAIGNVTLSVSSPLAGLFANDTEFLGDTFVLTSPAPGVPTPTTGGGTVTVQANGTFTYTTAAGTTATSDSFTYTIADGGGLTGTGTVTFTIAGLVWFVDRDAPAGGTGTQASPFDALADVNGAGGAGDPDAPNHYIYLFDRAAAIDYTGGLELESGQRLVGSGAALVVGATTVLPAGTPPTVVNTTGHALQLASGVRIEGLDVQAANDSAIAGSGALGTVVVNGVNLALSGTGRGLDLAGHAGSVTYAAGAITGGGTGTALAVAGGTGTVDLSTSSINRTAGRLVDVQTKTGGSVTLGTVTGTGAATDAIVLANNSATTLSFPSGFNVTTTNGRGLLANNTGSISIGGTTSTVNATGQASLEILDTSINGTATFASLSSASSLGPGLRLESGVSGALVVTGGVTVTNPFDVGIGIQFTTLSVTIGGPTLISGAGDDVSLVVSGSTGNMSFGATTITGGSDAVRLLNNGGGTRTFASLDASGNTGVGLLHNNGGAVTVTGNATFTPGGTGIDIQNSVAAVSFNGITTVNKSGSPGLGLNLVNNASGPSFATLNVTTSNGAGIAIATSPFGATGGTISATGGPAVNATGGAFVASFGSVSSTNSPVQGMNLVSCSGTLTAAAGTITNALGTAFNVNGGAVTASYGGSVTQNAALQRVVDVQGTTGGTVTVNTATGGASSTGVNIGNANGNVTFGTLDLGTSGSRMTSQAVTITGGNGTYNLGTAQIFTSGVRGLNAQNADGTIASTGGLVDATGAVPAALEIDGPAGLTTLAMTLTRVDVNGAVSGIRLVDTGGTFTVAGTGAAGTGGTLQNTTSDSIVLTNAAGVSLSFMNVSGSQESGILGSGVNGLNLTSCSFTGNGNDSADVGVKVTNLTGTATWTNTTITGSALANAFIDNTAGTLSSFTISGGSYSSLGTAFGGNSILINIHGTAVLTAGSITNASFLNNKPARAITVQAQENGRVGDAPPATTNAFVVQNCVFTNNGLHGSFESGPVPGGNMAFRFLGNGGGGTPMTMTLPSAGTSHALNAAASSQTTTGSLRGRVANNVVGNAAVASSGSPIGNGLRVFVQGKTAGTLLVDANVMRQIPQARGVDAQFLGPTDASGAPTSDITVTNNDVNPQDASGFPLAAIYVGADSQGGGTVTTRSDVRGNVVPTGGPCGGACDVLPAFLIVDEVVAAAVGQLVDNAPGSATCTQELTELHTNPAHNHTGSAAGAAGCALIPGPIVTPP